jgi:DNA-binding PadR family transcriptional regulator
MTNDSSQKGCEHIEMPQSVPRGLLRHIIPRLLQKNELTGTEIMQRLNDLTDGAWNPSPGTIYPLLSSLEEEGIIEAVAIEGRSKTYSLTENAKKRLELMLKHRLGAVGEKTRLGPWLWEKLLEPEERIQFHMHGMKHSIETFDAISGSLSKKQQQQLLRHLKEMATKITGLIDKLQAGAKTNE